MPNLGVSVCLFLSLFAVSRQFSPTLLFLCLTCFHDVWQIDPCVIWAYRSSHDSSSPSPPRSSCTPAACFRRRRRPRSREVRLVCQTQPQLLRQRQRISRLSTGCQPRCRMPSRRRWSAVADRRQVLESSRRSVRGCRTRRAKQATPSSVPSPPVRRVTRCCSSRRCSASQLRRS